MCGLVLPGVVGQGHNVNILTILGRMRLRTTMKPWRLSEDDFCWQKGPKPFRCSKCLLDSLDDQCGKMKRRDICSRSLLGTQSRAKGAWPKRNRLKTYTTIVTIYNKMNRN